MGTVLEDTGTGHESKVPEYFLDARLGILEQGSDRMMQMIKTLLASIPRLVAHYEDPNASEQVRAYLHTFRQGKKTVREYTEEFKRQAAKIQGWPDGVLAKQYRLRLHPDIREMVLRTV
ncbi:UNVERIFIED_CONTAM: hypothetical protein K2H54_056261 [Gekko kuhli]